MDALGQSVSEPASTAAVGDAPAPSSNGVSVAVRGLFALACIYGLYFAREVLMPIAIGILLAFLFSPAVDYLAKKRVPKPLSAALIVVSLLGVLIGGIYLVANPAKRWIAEMPRTVEQVQGKIRQTLRGLEDARKQVEDMIQTETPKRAAPAPASEQRVTITLLDVASTTWSAISQIGWGTLIVLSLVYMLLISEDIFKARLIKVLPKLSERKQALYIVEGVKREVATYLLTITAINFGVGLIIGVALYFAGLPNAILWGVLAGALNYLPYIGPMAGVIGIGIVGVLSFAQPTDALLPMALYLGVHAIESQVVTPALVGRRLTLNPAVILLAIILWGWLWGIVGAIIAVPILAIIKVFCDNVPSLTNLGELLSGRENPT